MHRVKTRTKIIIAISLVFSVIVPYLLQGNRYYIDVFTMLGVYVILGVSMNLLIGYSGQISLGMAGFYGIGAYTSVLLVMRLKAPFIVGLLCAAVLCFIVGFILGFPSTKLNFIFLGISTGGLNTIIFLIINNSQFTGGATGIMRIPQVKFLGENMTKLQYYFMVLIFVIVITYICFRIVNSKTGRALKAIRDNPIAASAVGINVNFYKLLVFAIVSSFTGVAGTLYAFNIRYIQGDAFTTNMSFKILTMGIIGGMGDLGGGVIGPILTGALTELLRDYNKYQLLIYSLLVILILRFMPRGLLQGLRPVIEVVEKGTGFLYSKLVKKPATAPSADETGKES